MIDGWSQRESEMRDSLPFRVVFKTDWWPIVVAWLSGAVAGVLLGWFLWGRG